jgi:hypothetical protein
MESWEAGFIAFCMSTHPRLGIRSPLSRAGFTPQNLCSILYGPTTQDQTKLKFTAFQKWRISTRKNVEILWIAQDDCFELFDVMQLGHRPDMCIRVNAIDISECKTQIYRPIFKQSVEARANGLDIPIFELLVLHTQTRLQLTLLCLLNGFKFSMVRLVVAPESSYRDRQLQDAFLDVPLSLSENECCTPEFLLSKGTFIIIIRSLQENAHFILSVNATDRVFLRGKGYLDTQIACCEQDDVESDWDVETRDLQNNAWGVFSLNTSVHPLLFQALQHRTGSAIQQFLLHLFEADSCFVLAQMI